MQDSMQQWLKNIDQFLEDLEKAEDDAGMRALFQSFDEKYDLDIPADPFSCEYREKQFRLYERLAGKAYTSDNEISVFDVAEMAQRPFPYCHASSSLVGDQLMAIGFIIKAMNLPAGARILEFGPGWGNTTLALAKMGYAVTAVDIEKRFVDLIAQRAEMEGLSIELIHGDFSLINHFEQKFDAVLFFECFHHCQDHLSLIRGCNQVLDKNGIICFGAEPINAHFPLPWGLRMDGESLWAIRKNGWLELGFNIKYFVDALRRNGFVCVEKQGGDGPYSHALIARREEEFRSSHSEWHFSFKDKTLFHNCGSISDGILKVSAGDRGIACYGPYRAFPKGQYEFVLKFQGPTSGTIDIELVTRSGTEVIARIPGVNLDLNNPIAGRFAVEAAISDLELRIVTNGGVEFQMEGLGIYETFLELSPPKI